MRRMVYAGAAFYIGDRTADAVLAYGAALASAGQTAIVDFPVRASDGHLGTSRLILGPGAQLLVQDVDSDWPAVQDDAGTIDRLRDRTVTLERSDIPDHWPPEPSP